MSTGWRIVGMNRYHYFLRLRDIGLYGTLQKKFKGKDMPDNFLKLSEELYERIIKREAIVNI